MPEILLIQPPIYDFYLTQKRTIPYGLLSIAGALEKEHFSVALCDGLATRKVRKVPIPHEMEYLKKYFLPDQSPFALFSGFKRFGYDEGHIGKLARDSKARLMGISSLFTPYHDYALAVAEAVKRFCPDAVIVMGGHHPTHFPEKTLDHPAVDFVIRGEGEIAMPLLAAALLRDAHRGALDEIPGLAFKKPDGARIVRPPAVAPDPDALPLPAIKQMNHGFYKRKTGGGMVVTSSRGCPFRCSYCSYGGPSFPPYRLRSVDSVMAEIDLATGQYGVRFIDFEDEQLSLDKTRFVALLNAIIKRPEKLELRAMNGLFPPSLDEDVIALMKQAGFKILNLSLGSACKTQLGRFNRPDVRPAFNRALDAAKRLKIEAVAYIIAGAIGQSAKSSIDDLLYLAYRRTIAGVSIFYPSPGSADFETCREMGILPAHDTLMRSSALPISDQTTRLESATLLRLSRMVNFMKSLLDSGKKVPDAAPFSPSVSLAENDSAKMGETLLSWFFHDGKIRGIDPSGGIYEHRIDARLTGMFLEKLDAQKIKGAKGQ